MAPPARHREFVSADKRVVETQLRRCEGGGQQSNSSLPIHLKFKQNYREQTHGGSPLPPSLPWRMINSTSSVEQLKSQITLNWYLFHSVQIQLKLTRTLHTRRTRKCNQLIRNLTDTSPSPCHPVTANRPTRQLTIILLREVIHGFTWPEFLQIIF